MTYIQNRTSAACDGHKDKDHLCPAEMWAFLKISPAG